VAASEGGEALESDRDPAWLRAGELQRERFATDEAKQRMPMRSRREGRASCHRSRSGRRGAASYCFWRCLASAGIAMLCKVGDWT
jgi:hypothetical protein